MFAGTETDLKAAFRFFAQGHTDPHPFHLTGDRGESFHIVFHRTGIADHFQRDGHHRHPIVEMKLHSGQRQPFQFDAGTGFDVKHLAVDHIGACTGFHQLRGHLMGQRGGVAVLKATGVGGDAGVQRFRQLRVKRNAHRRNDLPHQHRRCTAILQQQTGGVAGVGQMVVDAQIDAIGV